MISRRIFSKKIVLSVLMGGTALSIIHKDSNFVREVLNYFFMKNHFDDSELASGIELGQAYLMQSKMMYNCGALITIAGSKNLPEVCSKLNKQVQLDFVNGDMVLVNNWLLSKTEAELFAIYAFYRTNLNWIG